MNMLSKLMTLALVTAAVPAMAHPSDRDEVYKVGQGAELVVMSDINVPPHTSEIHFSEGYKISATFKDLTGGSFTWFYSGYIPKYIKSCTLNLRQASSKDRVLKAGQVLVFSGDYESDVGTRANDPTDYNVEYTTLKVKFESTSAVDSITCRRVRYIKNGQAPWATIGDMKEQLKGWFGLLYPQPEEIR